MGEPEPVEVDPFPPHPAAASDHTTTIADMEAHARRGSHRARLMKIDGVRHD
jgi:hypothetical protein